MKRFARLFTAIDETNQTNEKVDAMVEYFREADPADAAWAVYFLGGGRPKRLIAIRRLADWAMAEAGIPDWLFEESYHSVGDLAETISLLLPETESGVDEPLHTVIEERVLALGRMAEEVQRASVVKTWRELGGIERFVFNKLITGAWRVGVSNQLVVRALSKALGVEEGVVAHRMSGHWEPTA